MKKEKIIFKGKFFKIFEDGGILYYLNQPGTSSGFNDINDLIELEKLLLLKKICKEIKNRN